jgi:hypothetical protein
MPFKGGLAARKGVTASDVDQGALAKGASVEMEHTSDPRLARQIALDHLAERPDYYEMLERCESDGVSSRDFWVLAAGVAVGWGLSALLKGTKV